MSKSKRVKKSKPVNAPGRYTISVCEREAIASALRARQLVEAKIQEITTEVLENLGFDNSYSVQIHDLEGGIVEVKEAKKVTQLPQQA